MATHAHMLPATLRHELDARPEVLVGRHVLVAGDGLKRSTYDEATAHGIRVSHYYGAAELSFVAWGAHAKSLRPFPGVEVASRSGELWVRSPYVCEGYLEADLVVRSDSAGWSTVGDRGEVVDGYVAVLGREGGITTAGATVMVADIEHVLRPHAVGDIVVVGLPHPELGEVVVAVVTRSDDVPHLRARSRQRLSTPQQPRRWLHLESLPLTTNGKVDRRAVVSAVSTSGALQ
ncbi:AMP-binding enzyme [Nocardioides endophyticus]